MSDTPSHGPETTPAAGGGGGGKWLMGATAAAVLLAGGLYAASSFKSESPPIEMASTDAAFDSSMEPPRGSVSPAPSAMRQEAPPYTDSTSPEATPAAPVRRRAAPRNIEVAEETIGVTPASLATNNSDEIIVSAGRRPVWVRTPNPRRLSALYPERALDRGREGEASIACTVVEDGALDCVRVSETPVNSGFGNAALRVARKFRHAPQRADGTMAAGTPVNLRVVFRIEEDERRRS